MTSHDADLKVYLRLFQTQWSADSYVQRVWSDALSSPHYRLEQVVAVVSLPVPLVMETLKMSHDTLPICSVCLAGPNNPRISSEQNCFLHYHVLPVRRNNNLSVGSISLSKEVVDVVTPTETPHQVDGVYLHSLVRQCCRYSL